MKTFAPNGEQLTPVLKGNKRAHERVVSPESFSININTIFFFSFFSNVNDQATLSKPTYTALLRLLNNYNHVIGHEELYTHTEELEISNFLHAISNTSVIQKTLAFLSREGMHYFKQSKISCIE